MPEGPSIVILKEAIAQFNRKKVIKATGNAKIDMKRLEHTTIRAIKSWGKHLLIVFKNFSVRVHMGLFGSYQINSHGKRNASLHMQFGDEEVNFYISKIKVIEGPLSKVYDWSADIMNKKWDTEKAIKKMQDRPKRMICDALLDQDIFSGSGNIIKNEALFRAKVHPESLCGDIPVEKLKELIAEVIKFSNDFLKWGKQHILGKHLEAYGKDTCPRNHVPFHKNPTGKGKRNTYYCTVCQVKYD